MSLVACSPEICWHGSAMVATLLPGSYTAIVHDAGGGKGVALVEVYDLEP